MPTYEYLCDACGHRFEEFQSITASPLRACPECTRRKLRRLIGAGAGILFKGSGFYETDYRSKSYQEAAKKETTESGGDAKKKDSDTTKAKKPDSKKSEKKD